MFSTKMLRWSNFAGKPAKSHEMGQYGHKGNTAAFHNATVPLLHYENSVSKQRYEKPGMIPGKIVTYKFRCLCVYGLANKHPLWTVCFRCIPVGCNRQRTVLFLYIGVPIQPGSLYIALRLFRQLSPYINILVILYPMRRPHNSNLNQRCRCSQSSMQRRFRYLHQTFGVTPKSYLPMIPTRPIPFYSNVFSYCFWILSPIAQVRFYYISTSTVSLLASILFIIS